MRLISFMLTKGQILAQTKTQTRRVGSERLKPGDRLRGVLQLRATAAAACRGGSGVDSSDYSLWVWGVPTAFRCSTSFGSSWRTFNVPAQSICGAIYRWENGRPGDGPLSPGLLQTIGAARRRREERAR